MMKGLTNALSQSTHTGSDIGDLVYAVNNTGANIVKNQKVWLNKHNLDESESEFFRTGADFANRCYALFDSDNNFSHLNFSTRYKWIYNTDDKTWTVSEIPISNVVNGMFLVYHNNDYYLTYLNNWMSSGGLFNFKYNDTLYEYDVGGYWINDTYRVVYVSSYTYNLIKVSDASVLYTFDFSSVRGYVSTIIYKNNKILIITNNTSGNNVYWYRINLEQDYVGPDSSLTVTPLVALDNSLVRTKNVIMYYTGIENDDYLFTLDTTNDANATPRALRAYKIVDNDIIAATDLQTDLQALVGQPCQIFYDDRVKRLYVSTTEKIYLFRWLSGEFFNVNITINPLDYITPYNNSYAFCFGVSDDMTTMMLQNKHASSSGTMVALKLATVSDEIYAENFAQCSSLSLTGFATGETDSQGRYEVNTVLPEVLNLTLNITPDITDDDISFKGEANDY